MKFAKATKFHRKSGEGLGDGSPRLWSAGGAALPTFGVPRLRRSDDVAESMSQPSRAGLMFGYRPYGPGSDLRFIAVMTHPQLKPPTLRIRTARLKPCRTSRDWLKKRRPRSSVRAAGPRLQVACKPNSVEDDHSSRRRIAAPLKRPPRRFPTVPASRDRNPG